jgi:drug/metabolite transporter (DMT)-like permease
MKLGSSLPTSGVAAALIAALLFGAGTPAAKALLQSIDPWMLAGWLYLGSGLGLTLYRRVIGAAPVRLAAHERGWLAGAVLAGGVIGPVLLMLGLTGMAASSASLLLNAEGVFTALLAWFVFKENVDRRIALGMAAIALGAALLSWPRQLQLTAAWPALAVLGACFAWAIDNNLTRKVSLTDASWIAAVKGLVAGPVNLALAVALGAALPAWPSIAGAMAVGLLAYGVSLTLFVVALRQLGTARTGAYFSVAPFFGALLGLVSGEPVTPTLIASGALMALGVWLHLTERHGHMHEHPTTGHRHEHVHDEHHQHAHDDDGGGVALDAPHTHWHEHAPLRHAHAHYPDAHHRHRH